MQLTNPFKRKEPIPMKKPKPRAECEIKARRDGSGRIIGIKRTGNCKREDILAFAQSNGIDMSEDYLLED